MISDDPISSIDPVYIFLAQFPRVRSRSSEFLNSSEEGQEDVRVVVGPLVLKNGNESLESHSRVDVLGGERTKRLVVLVSVEFDKDDVPYLQARG